MSPTTRNVDGFILAPFIAFSTKTFSSISAIYRPGFRCAAGDFCAPSISETQSWEMYSWRSVLPPIGTPFVSVKTAPAPFRMLDAW